MSIPLYSGPKASILAFSFSGLLTATHRLVARITAEEQRPIGESERREVARVFQEAAIAHLIHKVQLAMRLEKFKGVRALVVSGGVASNQVLRVR